ncbi:MAG: cysteine desulfurase [Vicinamibacteria bacterium]|nr:cysteine desulfurase [Vicinamibacteria bacterium]
MTTPAAVIPPQRVKDCARKHAYDFEAVRQDFPILRQIVHGRPLVYLDNAATAQKPRCVIEAERRLYEEYYANIHRGVHDLSMKCTEAYDAAREKVRRRLNAAQAEEIVFVRGATEAVNLVAGSYGRSRVGQDDEILISALEHHSNIVPWQMLCEEKGARLRVIPMFETGELDLDALDALLGPRTRLLAITHVSNALGTVIPVREIVARAHARNVPVLVDGAQAVPHAMIDVRDIGCDFYVFSGHKAYGPSGIGALYGRRELLEAMPPYQGGGNMILSVTFEKTIYNEVPYRFEAGTPNIAGAIALGAALDYVESLGLDRIIRHEDDLMSYATDSLSSVPDLRIVGTAREKIGVISFVLEDIHPHDIGTILDHEGVAIRSGHHCAQPVMQRLGLTATARASFGLYNTREDVDALVGGIQKVIEVFA